MRWIALAVLAAVATAAPAATTAAPAACDRACLYGFLDTYLAALRAKAPDRGPWSPEVRNTENNVALRIGDGLWGTVTGIGTYDLRFADPVMGSVGFYGVVDESGTTSPFSLRLKVERGRITEIETLVVRKIDAGSPFVDANLTSKPMLNEIVPPALRSSRKEMIALADGYFSTLQQNDGTLHTVFDEACNRRENGYQTTNNQEATKTYGFSMGLGCADQFKLGFFRFDDRLRGRRVLAVDEERGLVMMAAFIDHSGRLQRYRLTNGQEVTANVRRPHSFTLLETFKIRSGKIQQVEANFTTVPYRMPSPWSAAGFDYE